MTRKARVHVPGGMYHVTLRGNHRLPIFFKHGDHDLLARLIAEYTSKYGMQIHAFCWMPNHIHMAIEVGDRPLAEAMRPAASRYSRAIQRRRGTSGHLFERRYHPVLVDSRRYLLTLVKYIHLNPVRAGLVADPAEYPWTGHRAYQGLEVIDWLATDRVLANLHADVAIARELYRQLLAETLSAEELALMRHGPPREQRDEPLRPILPAVKPPGRLSNSEGLEGVIQKSCTLVGVEPGDLTGNGRSLELRIARALVTWSATRRGLATLRQLQPLLGRAASTLLENLSTIRARYPALFEQPRVPVTDNRTGPNTTE